MCRLYAMRANEPTRIECSLVHAQNALMRQSKGDAEGLVHGHGWGIADFSDGVPKVEKQTWAAFHGEHFSKSAARTYGHTAIAHVRRATVGAQSIENTHPFEHGRWIFAHNGTVPNFLKVRDRMIRHIDPLLANDIKGTTDSEHIFHYLLGLHMHHPDAPLATILGHGLRRIIDWSLEVDATAPIGLNVVMTDGSVMVGSRHGRTLWHLMRDSVVRCDICGGYHVHHNAGEKYRIVEFASEPITAERWLEVGEDTIWSISSALRLEMAAIPEIPDPVLCAA